MSIQIEFEFSSSPKIFTGFCLVSLDKNEIHFPNIISTTAAHIHFKFDILMCLINIQVKF